jgi:hypothetical protein
MREWPVEKRIPPPFDFTQGAESQTKGKGRVEKRFLVVGQFAVND